jgi:VIT1/CCC1 family predicted Fe2+/Mn2+ transporter
VLAREHWVPLPEVELGRENVRESLASVMYSFAALVPVVLPLVVIGPWEIARWVSIGVAVATLYVVGIVWGRRDQLPPVACGLVLLGVGVALVATSLLFEALV